MPRQERRQAGTIRYDFFPKLKNDDIDAGSINDPGRRLACHTRGRVTATRPFLPLSLHSHIAVADDEFPTGKELTS